MKPRRVTLQRFQNGASTPASDSVAVEEPLEIRVGGRGIAITMRTPGNDRELALGFLLSEGVIRSPNDVLDVLVCRDLPEGQSGNALDVLLAPHVAVDFARLSRHVFSSSSCGICGKATLDALLQTFPAVDAATHFSAPTLAALPGKLRTTQPGFDATGGVHASALFDASGTLLAVREDVGRHNALDKLLGWALSKHPLPLRDCGLLVSGRVSFELVQKALSAGLPLIAGIGAPSSLAIECAERGGQTLVGFLSKDRFNVYTGDGRLSSVTDKQYTTSPT